MNKLILFLLA